MRPFPPASARRGRRVGRRSCTGCGCSRCAAEYLSVRQRTARRILKRLERAGAAVPTGIRQEGQTGRPPIVYRVRL
ncbi:hypothetical protein EBF04_20605 [Streptomyces sp. I6]|nr:hypothetical protein EBF04_20605 [Streptomyces sp. I6]